MSKKDYQDPTLISVIKKQYINGNTTFEISKTEFCCEKFRNAFSSKPPSDYGSPGFYIVKNEQNNEPEVWYVDPPDPDVGERYSAQYFQAKYCPFCSAGIIVTVSKKLVEKQTTMKKLALVIKEIPQFHFEEEETKRCS